MVNTVGGGVEERDSADCGGAKQTSDSPSIVHDSNVKNGKTNIPISFGNETKTFWYCSRISLIENRLFPFGPESALLDK